MIPIKTRNDKLINVIDLDDLYLPDGTARTNMSTWNMGAWAHRCVRCARKVPRIRVGSATKQGSRFRPAIQIREEWNEATEYAVFMSELGTPDEDRARLLHFCAHGGHVGWNICHVIDDLRGDKIPFPFTHEWSEEFTGFFMRTRLTVDEKTRAIYLEGFVSIGDGPVEYRVTGPVREGEFPEDRNGIYVRAWDQWDAARQAKHAADLNNWGTVTVGRWEGGAYL